MGHGVTELINCEAKQAIEWKGYDTGTRTSCWLTCKQGKLVKKRGKINEDERDHSNPEISNMIPLSLSLSSPQLYFIS